MDTNGVCRDGRGCPKYFGRSVGTEGFLYWERMVLVVERDDLNDLDLTQGKCRFVSGPR